MQHKNTTNHPLGATPTLRPTLWPTLHVRGCLQIKLAGVSVWLISS